MEIFYSKVFRLFSVSILFEFVQDSSPVLEPGIYGQEATKRQV